MYVCYMYWVYVSVGQPKASKPEVSVGMQFFFSLVFIKNLKNDKLNIICIVLSGPLTVIYNMYKYMTY